MAEGEVGDMVTPREDSRAEGDTRDILGGGG